MQQIGESPQTEYYVPRHTRLHAATDDYFPHHQTLKVYENRAEPSSLFMGQKEAGAAKCAF